MDVQELQVLTFHGVIQVNVNELNLTNDPRAIPPNIGKS